MKKLLLATAALLATLATAQADIIKDLGPNPDSGAGAFANTNPGTGGGGSGLFTDIYTFTLSGGPQFLTIAFATNTFSGGDPQKIQNFTGAVLNMGTDNAIGGVGTAADFIVIGPELAAACGGIPNCQVFGGSAILSAASYYLRITGDAGVDAGYGGNLSTAAVPGPIVGAGLPGLIAACFAMVGLGKRRRKKLAVG